MGITRQVVDRLYDAYLARDQEAMLALMSPKVSVRFLGRVDLEGIDEVRDFLAFNDGTRTGLDFLIRQRLIDGEWAAVIWAETARVAATGLAWRNHGVDLVRVVDGEVDTLHVNNDVQIVRQHLPRYEKSARSRDE